MEQVNNNVLFTFSTAKNMSHANLASDVVLVNKHKLFIIIEIESIKMFMIEWYNLIEQNILWEMCQIVEAMTIVNSVKEELTTKVTLLTEYTDFANIFSK